jgi:hypothetical protein
VLENVEVEFQSCDQARKEGRTKGSRKRERRYEREDQKCLVLEEGGGRGGKEIQHRNLPPFFPSLD